MALTADQAKELRSIVERRRAALAREVGLDLERVREDGLDNVVGAVPDPSELRTLDAARARMDDGSYGICSNCGQDIGFERLRANPGAERCIKCQTQFEKTHGAQSRSSL